MDRFRSFEVVIRLTIKRKMITSHLGIALVGLFIVGTPSAFAGESSSNKCLQLVLARLQGLEVGSARPLQSAKVTPTLDEWLKWEEQGNMERFREPVVPAPISAVKVPRSSALVRVAEGADPRIVASFVDENEIRWPQHPYNQAKKIQMHRKGPYEGQVVPYAAVRGTPTWEGRLTASRSIFLTPDGSPPVTVKVPTSHPHPTTPQPGKLLNHLNVALAIPRANLVTEVEEAAGKDSMLIILKDVLAVEDRATGNGFLVRDLSQLSPDKHYLPAFSMPFAWGQISKSNPGYTLESFMLEFYTKQVGRQKARLAMKYGLVMDTPNSQNWLIELDQNYKPTGRLALRDLTDSFIYRPVLAAIGKTDVLKIEPTLGQNPVDRLKPAASTSYFMMNEAPGMTHDLTARLAYWESEAYYESLHEMLNLDEAGMQKLRAGFQTEEDFMSSPEVQEAIRSFHRAGTPESAAKIDMGRLPGQKSASPFSAGLHPNSDEQVQTGFIELAHRSIDQWLGQRSDLEPLVPRDAYWRGSPKTPRQWGLSEAKKFAALKGKKISGVTNGMLLDTRLFEGRVLSTRIEETKLDSSSRQRWIAQIQPDDGSPPCDVALWDSLSSLSLESYVWKE